VFHEEIMSSVNLISGVKMTKLTLALLEDTGYYSEVNYDWAETNMWGYKKGC
jgi:hypothetical protein